MTKDAFKQADNILKRIHKIDLILELLEKSSAVSHQEKDVVERENIVTDLTFWLDDGKNLQDNGLPFPGLHLTTEHIEVMQTAFERRKSELNVKFNML